MRKDKLIEKYRHINVEYNDWSTHVISDFIVDMKEEFGLEISSESVRFSGFWSQGDGASFLCQIDKPTLKGLMEKCGLFEKHPKMDELFNSDIYELSFTMSRNSSRYCHQNTIDGNLVLEDFASFHISSDMSQQDVDFVYSVCNAAAQQWASILSACDADLMNFLRDQMRELYSRLENEYEFLVSDEQVWETISANDMDKELEECED